jgi:hypothetical protein
MITPQQSALIKVAAISALSSLKLGKKVMLLTSAQGEDLVKLRDIYSSVDPGLMILSTGEEKTYRVILLNLN